MKMGLEHMAFFYSDVFSSSLIRQGLKSMRHNWFLPSAKHQDEEDGERRSLPMVMPLPASDLER
jgi:hypothetical protein